MVDKNLLVQAGVPGEDVSRLEQAWNALCAAKARDAGKTPRVVCTGIYNAGKSTLLNALAGKEIFPTGDIPTTKALANAEFGGAVYTDTPGLNAEEADDQEAQSSCDSADFILFVSNAQDGGVSETEAAWLRRFCKRYTADGFEKRLIYVLTHCTQVEPEQLPAIRERVRGDLAKAAGIAVEPVRCVDSITYQQGRAEGEPLLVEHSGIPELQAYLAERIASAEETLRRAREAELAERRQELLEQIDRCTKHCRSRMNEQAAYTSQKDIDALFAATREKLDREIPSSVSLYGGISFHAGGKSFDGKDGGALRRQARDHVRTFAGQAVTDARAATDKMFRQAQKDYGSTGMNSAYFKACDAANQLLEQLQLELAQRGVQTGAVEEIKLDPDVSDVAAKLAEIAGNADYWSAGTYLDVFGNRIEENRIDGWYEERGMFGFVKRLPRYTIRTYLAIQEIDAEISKVFYGRVERAQDCLNWYYWKPFLEELRAEADKRLKEMRQGANDSAAAQESAGQPLRAALEHLFQLRDEVGE